MRPNFRQVRIVDAGEDLNPLPSLLSYPFGDGLKFQGEETAHRRLQIALQRGDPFQIEAAQMFWLRCSESLRELDLSIEPARRDQEQQVPLKLAQDVVTFASEWLRISFMQFLSSEGRALMGIRDFGEWKFYALQRFKGILDLTVKNANKTNSAIPDWAKERIKTAWNVQ